MSSFHCITIWWYPLESHTIDYTSTIDLVIQCPSPGIDTRQKGPNVWDRAVDLVIQCPDRRDTKVWDLVIQCPWHRHPTEGTKCLGILSVDLVHRQCPTEGNMFGIFHFPWHRHPTEGTKCLADLVTSPVIDKPTEAPNAFRCLSKRHRQLIWVKC